MDYWNISFGHEHKYTWHFFLQCNVEISFYGQKGLDMRQKLFMNSPLTCLVFRCASIS